MTDEAGSRSFAQEEEESAEISRRAHLLCCLQAFERDRSRGEALLGSVRSGTRTLSSLSSTERRLHDLARMEALLARCVALRYEHPEGMVEAAEGAREIAFRVHALPYGQAVVADLRARALAELGNAYRINDDLDRAATALGEAAHWLERGTGDEQLLARLGELAASLYRDQRRFDMAIGLLEKVRRIYERIGDSPNAARAAIIQAMVNREAGNTDEAIRLHFYGMRRLWPAGDPHLKLTVVHDLALCLIDAGQADSARLLVAGARRLYGGAGELNRIRLIWLRGKVWSVLELDVRAEGALHKASAAFTQAGKPGDAALVSLDLALLWLRQGRRDAIVSLVGEMLQTFQALGIRRELLATFVVLRQSCTRADTRPEVIEAHIRMLGAVLAEIRSRR
jgi:tetratricopeptide (TPR) repeat protein